MHLRIALYRSAMSISIAPAMSAAVTLSAGAEVAKLLVAAVLAAGIAVGRAFPAAVDGTGTFVLTLIAVPNRRLAGAPDAPCLAFPTRLGLAAIDFEEFSFSCSKEVACIRLSSTYKSRHVGVSPLMKQGMPKQNKTS
jgi:hypothetical protein